VGSEAPTGSPWPFSSIGRFGFDRGLPLGGKNGPAQDDTQAPTPELGLRVWDCSQGPRTLDPPRPGAGLFSGEKVESPMCSSTETL
jgi:hypothetical protein